MSGSTLGRVKAVDERLPEEILAKIIESVNNKTFPEYYSIDEEETGRRLIDWCSPSAFEHLSVHLLQLEQPEMVWRHVGGSGDGGVDGLGSREGRTEKVLQCKLFGLKPENFLKNRKLPIHLTTLDVKKNKEKYESSDLTIWDRPEISRLVKKHAKYLPLAKTLRIGQ